LATTPRKARIYVIFDSKIVAIFGFKNGQLAKKSDQNAHFMRTPLSKTSKKVHFGQKK
jgi:hypothetical protein